MKSGKKPSAAEAKRGKNDKDSKKAQGSKESKSSDVLKEGTLEKLSRSQLISRWQSRWFVLRPRSCKPRSQSSDVEFFIKPRLDDNTAHRRYLEYFHEFRFVDFAAFQQTMLRDDQTACSFTNSSIYDLSNVEGTETPAGKRIELPSIQQVCTHQQTLGAQHACRLRGVHTVRSVRSVRMRATPSRSFAP